MLPLLAKYPIPLGSSGSKFIPVEEITLDIDVHGLSINTSSINFLVGIF